jgi:hypothetical protein
LFPVAVQFSRFQNEATLDLVRHHRANDRMFLYAFDLIELNGDRVIRWRAARPRLR